MKKVYLHIGAHKTGSTSIQAYLRDHRVTLATNFGVHFYKGVFLDENHLELPLCAITDSRPIPYQIVNKLYVSQPSLRISTAERVAEFLEAGSGRYVFSAEDLSFLRKPEELYFLRSLFSYHPVSIVLLTRNVEDFLRSYKKMMQRMGMHQSPGDRSFAYAESDSWLGRWEDLISVYRTVFPDVSIINYDREVASCGSVLPGFLSAIGIDLIDAPDWNGYYLNKTEAE